MGRMNRSTRDFYNFALGFALTLLLIHATKLMNAITANRMADQHLYSVSTPVDTKEQPSKRPTKSLHQLDINRVWVSEKNPKLSLVISF
jgi:signal transduction histidine kinase